VLPEPLLNRELAVPMHLWSNWKDVPLHRGREAFFKGKGEGSIPSLCISF
jgi:hypothetical protein